MLYSTVRDYIGDINDMKARRTYQRPTKKVEFGEGEGKVPLDNIAKRAEEYKPKERVTYCMETALFYYRYSDRNPAEWNFAIDKNVSKRRTKIDYPFIKAYRVESELVTLGETEGEIDFHKVRIYDRDRTICDVLRNMNKIDKEVFNKAVQGYVKDPKKNIPNLIEYAKALRVQTRVKELIGVWL